jgi:hypothetical protein
MNPEDLFPDWKPERPRERAVICDIDDTLCTEFDCPILIACQMLVRIDRTIAVHYVTARPEEARPGTERFLETHRLPGWRNLHFCPRWQASRTHKTEVMTRLAREYQVLVSIGDADEDEAASLAAGVPFVRVGDDNLEDAWRQIANLVGLAWSLNP